MILRSLALATLLGAALSATQAPPPHQGPKGPHAKAHLVDIHRWSRALELTQAQQSQLQAILESHKESAQASRRALGEARRAFDEAMESVQTTDARLTELKAVLDSAELALVREERGIYVQAMAVLTPDQTSKLDALRAEHRKRQEGRAQPSGPRNPDSRGRR